MMPIQLPTEIFQSPSSGEVRGLRVPPDSIAGIAGLLTPLLSRSTELCNGRLYPEDVFRAAQEGEMQVWLAYDQELHVLGMVVTEIVQYPARRACLLIQCAGDALERWVHMLPDIEGWAKGRGCTLMEIQGRRGWKRRCSDYTEAHTVFEKELT